MAFQTKPSPSGPKTSLWYSVEELEAEAESDENCSKNKIFKIKKDKKAFRIWKSFKIINNHDKKYR